jgi:hypothetical protein
MIYRSEFKVDVRQLSILTKPDLYLDSIKRDAAREIGEKICENIPFKRNEEKSERRAGQDFNNYPPVLSQNAIQDHYQTEFFAVSLDDWEEFRRLLNAAVDVNGYISKHDLINALKDIESK